MSSYFAQHVKKMIFLGFLLFYIGLILRFTTADTETDFTAARFVDGYRCADEQPFDLRIVMALDLELWWLRSVWFIMVVP